MYTLDPLSIALQGLGYGTLHTALQGFVAEAEVAPPTTGKKRQVGGPRWDRRRQGTRDTDDDVLAIIL